MAKADKRHEFLYAQASAAPPERGSGGPELWAGIGVTLKDRYRRTVLKCGHAVRADTHEEAAYEAVIFALREAYKLGTRSIAVYCDHGAVVAQINRESDVPDTYTARYLEVRALMNQFRWSQVRPGEPGRHYGVQGLAQRAAAGSPTAENYEQQSQLSLVFPE
jgi:ribonuclease HI